MYEIELRRTERLIKLKKITGVLKNKNIYLFGVSDNTRQIIQILREEGYEPKGVIDNDITKQGSFCSRIKVISMSSVSAPNNPNTLYLIYSAYWREMIPQLVECGIRKRNIIRLIKRRSTFLELLFHVFLGKLVNASLKREYGDVPIFVCPYTGTGDIYLIGTFWQEYISRNNITDYVFLVISGACKKVASLFDINNIVVFRNKRKLSYLIFYYLYDNEKGRIKILNDCWAQVHTNQTEWFRGYKGLFFTNLFRKYVFGLPDYVAPKHPTLKDETERVEHAFNEYGLIPGKTVVLSPYSNTLSDLPTSFWATLTKELKMLEYVVVTNSSGKTEPPVEGTKGVFFPLDIAPQFVECASCFIGVRSGLCDIISGAKAKKIILYDKLNRFYMSSVFEYFSLKEMELCDDAIEIQYENDGFDNVILTIINELKGGHSNNEG